MADSNPATTERLSFTLDPNLIRMLVNEQAGTLGKGLLECVMNSIDAGAKRIDIDFDDQTFRVRDNGMGLQTRDEVIALFGNFGFKHDENDHRTYGRFGMGRAQLWAFGTSSWRTGTFRLDVDVKHSGMDYDLTEHLPPVQGVEITGTFYKPLTLADRHNATRELSSLAKYAQIEVRVNGERINLDPACEKWDVETDQAYIKYSDRGTMIVYNLGVEVRHYPASHIGSGGVIVSKQPLRVNFARNDILVSQCSVWPEIRKTVSQHAQRKARNKSKRLTDDDRENLAMQVLGCEVESSEALKLHLITDARGRQHSLMTLFQAPRGQTRMSVVPPAEGDEAASNNRIAERLHTAKQAFMIARRTLDRFGMDSIESLRETVAKTLTLGEASYFSGAYFVKNRDLWSPIVPFSEIRGLYDHRYEIIAPKDYTPMEKVCLRILNKHSAQLAVATGLSAFTDTREIALGQSETANAWTDGHRSIFVKRSHIRNMAHGITGVSYVVDLLLHEYCHRESDMGETDHDLAFYRQFHDARLHCNRMLAQKTMLRIFKALVNEVEKKPGLKFLKGAVESGDLIERAEKLSVAVPSQESAEEGPVDSPTRAAKPLLRLG